MGILRWFAEADTTITNAYKADLSARGVKANMGIADALEVFVLHGQAAKSGSDSKELARILIRFNVEKLRDSLVAGDVPLPNATNAPKYILRLFNAKHPETLPRNFTLSLHKSLVSWDEGSGLDMSEYSDIGAASWTNRLISAGSSGTGTITVQANPSTAITVTVDDETYTITPGGSAPLTATAIHTALNGPSDKVTTAVDGAKVTLTSRTAGELGNYRFAASATTGTFETSGYYLAGGSDYTAWTSGGNSTANDINVGNYTGTGTTTGSGSDAIGSVTFSTGEEDIELDVTTYIQDLVWNSGALVSLSQAKTNNTGILIKVIDENIVSSVYTKKFFARSSEFFFKRPCIEARWNSSEKDQRSNFYAEDSLLTNAQNANSIYLYNSVGGERANYTLGGSSLFVRFYSDPDYTQPISIKDGNNSFSAAAFATTTNSTTGVYGASVVLDTKSSMVYDKWYVASAGGAAEATWTVVYSGSIRINQRELAVSQKKEKYIFNITNLKNSYSRTEKPRFRVYTRLKDWSPTIYTKARKSLESKIVDNVYFKIFRVVDDEVVFGYGRGTTGVSNNQTLLSYDAEGSYFDFDMSLLEAGYMYGIRLMTSIDGVLTEQKEIFKFRVD